MKKNLFLWRDGQVGKWINTFCLCLFLVGVTSCSEGFDDNERFSGGVTGVTLESPEPSKITLSKLPGTTNVKIEWPVVVGAGGYMFSFYNIDDPENPILVGEENELVDGCSAIREYTDETRYKVVIKTLGNEKLNNKEAVEASNKNWDTYLPATSIPDGTDLTVYFAENQIATANGEEVGYELVPGGSYTMSGVIDFDLNMVTLRGDKVDHPTVTLSEEAGFVTQAGLQLRWINFDCTKSTRTGFLSLSENPSSTISIEELGYKKDGANQNGFVINGAVNFQECFFKNVNKSLLHGSKKNWSLRSLSIMGCIVQLNNATSNSVLDLSGASNGLIKILNVKNSTFYNLVKNESGFFIRYSNASNAQPKKIFGDSDNSSTFTIEYNTFSHVMSNKNFANTMPNTNTLVTTVQYNIFYDVQQMYQIIQSQAYMLTAGNTIFADGVKTWGGTPNGNDTGDRKDKEGNPYATLEDPDFVGPFEQELDFSQVNGGINFTPRGPIAVGNNAGDPRWYE